MHLLRLPSCYKPLHILHLHKEFPYYGYIAKSYQKIIEHLKHTWTNTGFVNMWKFIWIYWACRHAWSFKVCLTKASTNHGARPASLKFCTQTNVVRAQNLFKVDIFCRKEDDRAYRWLCTGKHIIKCNFNVDSCNKTFWFDAKIFAKTGLQDENLRLSCDLTKNACFAFNSKYNLMYVQPFSLL